MKGVEKSLLSCTHTHIHTHARAHTHTHTHIHTHTQVPSADIQSRLAMLEAENRRLKDSLRTGKEPPDSNAALRKKIIKLSQKNFFLVWEKKQLADKLQISLKVARETRDRVANDQARRLREENRSLVEKVRGLEESLLKRTMATDSRIAETVKENVRLHQRLVSLKSCFEEAAAQQALIKESLSWAREDGPRAVREIETSLTGFKRDLQELAAGQERLKAVHSELQQLMSSETVGKMLPLSRTSSGSSQSLPPVLKSLNPSYLSQLHSSSPPPISLSAISSPFSRSPSVPQVRGGTPAAVVIYCLLLAFVVVFCYCFVVYCTFVVCSC